MAWKLHAIEQTQLRRKYASMAWGARNLISTHRPGFKKRPNTAGAQPMGGLPIEEFLAVMNGGGDSGDLVGKLMQLGISLASNAG